MIRRRWHPCAIIGADTKLDDLVLATLPWWERPLVRLFVARRLFDAVEMPYARIALNEADAGETAAPTPLHARIAALYKSGTEPPARGIRAELPSLPPFAHDFVIPSISQALHVLSDRPEPPSFLDNVVNPRATHASGGDEREFVSDRRPVLAMLRKMGAALK